MRACGRCARRDGRCAGRDGRCARRDGRCARRDGRCARRDGRCAGRDGPSAVRAATAGQLWAQHGLWANRKNHTASATSTATTTITATSSIAPRRARLPASGSRSGRRSIGGSRSGESASAPDCLAWVRRAARASLTTARASLQQRAQQHDCAHDHRYHRRGKQQEPERLVLGAKRVQHGYRMYTVLYTISHITSTKCQ